VLFKEVTKFEDETVRFEKNYLSSISDDLVMQCINNKLFILNKDNLSLVKYLTIEESTITCVYTFA
jgi:hypothetical protein